MRWILAVLVTVLAACAGSTSPPFSGFDWRLTPREEVQTLWRFTLTHPVHTWATETIEASAAKVTEAGLEIVLDEWGGSKSAKWTGITGGRQDRTRVKIEVQRKDGTWRAVFSGSLVRRPTRPAGEREAVGDKYLRLKEIPVERDHSAGGAGVLSLLPGIDVGEAMRDLVRDARFDLPHLVVGEQGAPNAGALGKRRHNGESVAAALDGLISLKKDWGWTVLPDDTFYIGPKPAREAVVNTAVAGVQVQLRDVVSEGLRNAIRWTVPLPGTFPAVYESRHANVNDLGRSSVTRYIDDRSQQGVVQPAAADIYYKPYGSPEVLLDPAAHAYLRDSGASNTAITVNEYVRVHLNAFAEWTEIRVLPLPDIDVVIEYSDGAVSGQRSVSGSVFQTVFLPPLDGGANVRLYPATRPSSGAPTLAELNPRALNRSLLDTAAEDLYRIPAQHAGTASVPGIQDPAGSARVRRPGYPEFTERVVGTRYLVKHPMRTEYLIGEPDDPEDNQMLKVLIERRDEQAVDQAVNTGNNP